MSDTLPKDSAHEPKHSNEELDVLAREIQRDVDAGVGLKHFEDVLDDSTAQTEFATADEKEQWARDEKTLLLAIKVALNEALVPQGMRVLHYGRPAGESNPTFIVKDREGREFKATIEYTEALGWAARDTMRQMVRTLLERVRAARATYYGRMGEAVPEILSTGGTS